MRCIFKKFVKILFYIIPFIVTVIACRPTTSPQAEVIVQPPEPTPTLEPTFTPSPALPSPTHTPSSLPPSTSEPTPTSIPQASLLGRILDHTTGQPIAEAKVSVGTVTDTTDADGRYALTGLPPDQYVLSVTHPDYDPGLSSIFTLATGQELALDLTLFAPDTSPYPEDPMLTNPLDPNGAPTKEDAERLAREQGLTGNVVGIEETKLRGEYLVNYKIGDDIRAAVAELNHEVWKLTDETGRKWWIIKVCGNLASPLPAQKPIPTPKPVPLPPMAEVGVDELIVRACTSDECAKVGTVPHGERVEVFGCLADHSWCEVSWSGGRGWCTGQSLRQLAVATVIPSATPVLPTPIPTLTVVVASGEEKITFVYTGEPGQEGVFVINPDGNSLTRLTNNRSDRQPAWSPDKKRITFSRGCDYYVMNVDSSGLTRLIDGPGSCSGLVSAWSLDGQQIAFARDGDIHVINVDSSGLTRLTDNSTLADYPAWSPDGTKIAFGGIHIMNADGSNLMRLSDIWGTYPDWSPNGQKIIFDYNGDIFVINADGSDLTRLTDHPTQDGQAAWSPDGQKIVFSSDRDGGRYHIYVMNIDGSGLTRLAPGLDPDW